MKSSSNAIAALLSVLAGMSAFDFIFSSTKETRFPDLAALQEERAAEFRADQKQERRKVI